MTRSVLVLCCLVACSDPRPAPMDAHSTVPRSAAGTFNVESSLDFALPPAARPALLVLEDATDGPDDPSRFIVDAMVGCLPDGTVAHVAAAAAPFVAAYLNTRLAEIAPRLEPGLAQLATGLARIAQHLDTVETIRIAEDGEMVRVVTGVKFGTVAMPFAQAGLPEVAGTAKVEMRDGRLAIPAHVLALPYAQLLQIGLDRAVVPAVVPHATDLAGALRELVDCTRIGALVAEEVQLGSATLYASACGAGMTALAARVESQLAAIGAEPLHLAVAGTATGVDADGDGTMDAIRDGAWLGQPGSSFVVSGGAFAGAR